MNTFFITTLVLQRKIIKKRQEAKNQWVESGKISNGIFGDEDDEDVKRLVQRLEEKHVSPVLNPVIASKNNFEIYL